MANFLDLGPMSQAIQNASNTILDYAILLAAVGTVAMALLELLKGVLRLRLRFHRFMIQKWTGNEGGVLEELLALAAGGKQNARVLFDQPTEKMLGQIQAAANVAVDYPTVHLSLYEFLTIGSATRDFRTVRKADQERWREFADRIAREGFPTHPDDDTREANQARNRLGNLVSRKLDALQNNIEYRWARSNQAVAIVMGAVFFWYTIHQTKAPEVLATIDSLTLIAISILAGLVSPFAKDVVTALSGLRTRR